MFDWAPQQSVWACVRGHYCRFFYCMAWALYKRISDIFYCMAWALYKRISDIFLLYGLSPV